MGMIGYLLFWAIIFFVMMRFGCGAHVMGHRHPTHQAAPLGVPGNGPWSMPAEALDPVCGKILPAAAAKSSLWNGHAYHFCSQDFREKFEAAPGTYPGSEPTVQMGV